MSIVPIVLTDPTSGVSLCTHALLDSGADVTLCTQDLFDQLGCNGPRLKSPLNVVGSKDSGITTLNIVDLLVEPESRGEVYRLNNVRTVEHLPIHISSYGTKGDALKYEHLKDLPFADVHPDSVSMIIGLDHPDLLIPQEIRVGKSGEPFAARTSLGWTLQGPVQVDNLDSPSGQSFAYSALFPEDDTLESLRESIDRFWVLETSGLYDRRKGPSVTDQKVVKMWDENVTQDDKSHYILPIPFKDERKHLPPSYNLAIQRLTSLHKSLSKSGQLDRYDEGINQLLEDGYVEQVPAHERERDPTHVWYLPHFGVTTPSKPKLRIVFDCAAKSCGVSLNSTANSGPDLTNSLLGVLLRFRAKPIAFMGDVKAMFHQVRVPVEQRNKLRFLWARPGSEVKQYRFCVHLFGGTWSPAVCTYALRRTATDYGSEFSSGTSLAVQKSFYVDDCLASFQTIEEASRLVNEIQDLLAKGGFHLTKFTSNSPELLKQFPPERCSKAAQSYRLTDSELEEHALGVKWNAVKDEFHFKATLPAKPHTMRGILSSFASVYDPLGLVSPVILGARMIVQDLHRSKVGWDDDIDPVIEKKWVEWKRSLSLVEDISFPRCHDREGVTYVTRNLFHFSDASEQAFGVASYLVSTDTTGQLHSQLLMAKSRLAPIKPLTLPRLELQAAVLATTVDELLRSELDITLERDSHFWTDAELVLSYIQNEKTRFNTYVSNRVAEIRAKSLLENWHHVPGNLNPADDCTRIISPAKLGEYRWQHGPEFVVLGPAYWPTSIVRPIPLGDQEVKKAQPKRICSALVVRGASPSDPSEQVVESNSLTAASTSSQETIPAHSLEHPVDRVLRYFSSWEKAVRCLARFMALSERLRHLRSSCESLDDDLIATAETLAISRMQKLHYSQEIDAVKRGEAVSKGSPLRKLCPQLERGLLVVGGRLHNSPLTERAKHPIILPGRHPGAEALFRDVHCSHAHAGPAYVVAEARKRFWVIGGTVLAKRISHNCFVCKRRSAKPITQAMADLPHDRVNPSGPAFSEVGVDFFGPICVKTGRTQTSKRYGCLFTCLATRAVHLEMAESLDSNHFMHVLSRFLARRGLPKLIRSDNGTNFQGAAKILGEEIPQWNWERVRAGLQKRGVKWVFNTPGASHHGGVWERQIRTVRRLLTATACEQKLTDGDLRTFLTVVEGIINNRPLTPLSDDPHDFSALTPNHLLLFRSADLPFPFMPDQSFRSHLMKRWKHVAFLADLFWKRWTREYLPLLQSRTKWEGPKRNVRVGDIVIMQESHAHRDTWPLARIIETYPGDDGLVRSVMLRTVKGTVKRPVTKLCLVEGVEDADP